MKVVLQKLNDNQNITEMMSKTVFIYVAWFEDISRQDELLLSPIYRLQKDTNHN